MNEAALKERLLELSDILSASPVSGAAAASSSEGIYLPEEASVKSSVDGCVDYLQLQVKYLLFDLEATKRENRYLRQMLQGRGRSEDSGEAD